MQTHRRILIIGDAGRGKTTFGKNLSEKTGLPHFSTDDYYWEKKFSLARGRELAYQMICSEVYNKLDSWIVDGSSKFLFNDALKSADVIYFFVHKSLLNQYYVLIKRYLGRKNSDTHKETLMNLYGMLKHVTRKRYDKKYTSHFSHMLNLIEPYKDKVVEVDSFEKINSILREC